MVSQGLEAGSGRQDLEPLLLRPLAQGCRSGGPRTARWVQFSCGWYGVGDLGRAGRGSPRACGHILPRSSGSLGSIQSRAVQISFRSLSSLESSCTLRKLCTVHTLLGSVPRLSCRILVAPRNGENYGPAMSPLTKGIQFPVMIARSVQPMSWISSDLLLFLLQPYFFHSFSKVLFPLKA